MRASFLMIIEPLLRMRLAISLGVLAFTASCQLPDVAPFVDATSQLKTAISSSGDAVVAELRIMPGANKEASELEQHWLVRNKAATALLQYAQSLDAIVSAGKSGSESIGNVIGSVKGLAEAAGIAIPASPEAFSVATDVGKFLYSQIANVRAAGSLERAMDEAQPAVEAIVQAFQKDFPDLDATVQAASQKIETAIVAEPEANQLRSQRKTICEAVEKDRDLAQAASRKELEELSGLLARVDTRYGTYQTRLLVVQERLRADRQLIHATAVALDSWVAAHAQLGVAVRNKQSVSVGALTSAAMELRELTRRIREL